MSTLSRTVLVDSNVLLDVLTEDPQWCAWSSAQLAAVADANFGRMKLRDRERHLAARGWSVAFHG